MIILSVDDDDVDDERLAWHVRISCHYIQAARYDVAGRRRRCALGSEFVMHTKCNQQRRLCAQNMQRMSLSIVARRLSSSSSFRLAVCRLEPSVAACSDTQQLLRHWRLYARTYRQRSAARARRYAVSEREDVITVRSRSRSSPNRKHNNATNVQFASQNMPTTTA